MFAKLKGKYFQEDRYINSRFTVNEVYTLDLYPPVLSFPDEDKTDEKRNPWGGDTITSRFDIKLQTGSSIIERSGSRPTSLTLYFARTSKNSADWKKVTLVDVLASPYERYEYDINTTTDRQSGIEWVDLINPFAVGKEWASGNYAMVFVTEDEHGNMGIAPSSSIKDDRGRNPRIFYIQTGK
jgi:hypothetical protein